MHYTVREYICDYDELGSLIRDFDRKDQRLFTRQDKFIVRIKLPFPMREVLDSSVHIILATSAF